MKTWQFTKGINNVIVTVNDDEENELKIGDILHKNGCIYIIDEIVEDIDYSELKACTCHRKEN